MKSLKFHRGIGAGLLLLAAPLLHAATPALKVAASVSFVTPCRNSLSKLPISAPPPLNARL